MILVSLPRLQGKSCIEPADLDRFIHVLSWKSCFHLYMRASSFKVRGLSIRNNAQLLPFAMGEFPEKQVSLLLVFALGGELPELILDEAVVAPVQPIQLPA